MTLALERADDALLVGRGKPGKDAGRAGGLGQLRVAHRLNLRAEQELLYRQAHFLADECGDDLVVAGEDLDVHAQMVELLQRLRSGVLGRVEEGQEAQQDQVGLILDRIGRLIRRPRHLLVGQSDHAEALTVQVVRYLPTFGVVLGQYLDDLSLDFHLGAQAKHLFDGALADQCVQSARIFDDHRHPASHEIERDLVNLAVLLAGF